MYMYIYMRIYVLYIYISCIHRGGFKADFTKVILCVHFDAPCAKRRKPAWDPHDQKAPVCARCQAPTLRRASTPGNWSACRNSDAVNVQTLQTQQATQGTQATQAMWHSLWPQFFRKLVLWGVKVCSLSQPHWKMDAWADPIQPTDSEYEETATGESFNVWAAICCDHSNRSQFLSFSCFSFCCARYRHRWDPLFGFHLHSTQVFFCFFTDVLYIIILYRLYCIDYRDGV